MTRSVSVVIPVKDGERLLGELLAAVVAQEPDEILVIDSGSRDGSVEIARAGGADLLEIPPEEFGHGRTRNLGAERTKGELIVFLTQDAVPVDGWLAAHREAFDIEERVGATFGPHLPWPDTSPMIARELEQFFAAMAPSGLPEVERDGGEIFLSNVNASYLRACWEELRFDDVPYAEDQNFGRALLAAGWAKVYHPGAAVRHAHDYGAVDFARRYYDETRALKQLHGYVEPARPDRIARELRRQVTGDRRWMARGRLLARRSRALDAALGDPSRRAQGRLDRRDAHGGPARGHRAQAVARRPPDSCARRRERAKARWRRLRRRPRRAGRRRTRRTALRDGPARQPRRPGTARRSRARNVGARAPTRGRGRAAVQARRRRALVDLRADLAARGARPHVHGLDRGASPARPTCRRRRSRAASSTSGSPRSGPRSTPTSATGTGPT